MSAIKIDCWIDLDSADFKLIEGHNWIRRFTLRSIELGAITIDKDGHLWVDSYPIHAELDGKLVGLRYSVKAVN